MTAIGGRGATGGTTFPPAISAGTGADSSGFNIVGALVCPDRETVSAGVITVEAFVDSMVVADTLTIGSCSTASLVFSAFNTFGLGAATTSLGLGDFSDRMLFRLLKSERPGAPFVEELACAAITIINAATAMTPVFCAMFILGTTLQPLVRMHFFSMHAENISVFPTFSSALRTAPTPYLRSPAALTSPLPASPATRSGSGDAAAC